MRVPCFNNYYRGLTKMKKYLSIAMFYSIAAMVGGVFYREFTKWNGFTGITALGKLHTHLFVLCMFIFMIIALFAKENDLEKQKQFRTFMKIYNIGVPLSAVMLLVRGVPQVLDITLSSGINSAISGIAGISHILIGIGIILLLNSLKKEFADR